MEPMRALTLREASSVGDARTERALERWFPRGREVPPGAPDARRAIDDPAVRAIAIDVVRRALRECGERDAMSLTIELVRFQTVSVIEENPEVPRMAGFLEAWSRDAGLAFRVHGAHDAWEIELAGASPERAVAYLFHADVVPVNDPPTLIEGSAVPSGWSVAPFEASVRDGRLYGRGTEDDKGPLAAAMVMLGALADAGLAPRRGAIVLAAGTAEEHEWDGMRRYAEEVPHARHVISVDSSYPVVVAESGFVSWRLLFPQPPARARAPARDRRPIAAGAQGGLFLTQVPDHAELLVLPARGESLEALTARARADIEAELASRADEAFGIELEPRDGALRIVARGRSAHSSTAEEGRNAIWLLSGVAARLDLAPGSVATALSAVHALFDGDHHGERLGLRYEDDLMGELLVAPTVLRAEEDGSVRLEINMRRPRGLTSDEFRARLDAALAQVRARFGEGITTTGETYVGEAHVAELEGELVPTLLEVWRSETGDRAAQPVSIRGGTYARLFPGAVDFGPALPGRPYTGHGADEHIALDALHATTRMLFEASIRLADGAEREPAP
jgi:dipeptidase D